MDVLHVKIANNQYYYGVKLSVIMEENETISHQQKIQNIWKFLINVFGYMIRVRTILVVNKEYVPYVRENCTHTDTQILGSSK